MPDFAIPEAPSEQPASPEAPSEQPAGPVLLDSCEMQELFLALESHVYRLEQLAVKWADFPHRSEWYRRRAFDTLAALSKFNRSRIDAETVSDEASGSSVGSPRA